MDMKIINSSDVCKGIWTRVEGKNRSVLDYVTMKKEDEELVKNMIIDEEREFTPYHQDGDRDIYTDHNTIQLDINWNMKYKATTNKTVCINEKTKLEFRNKTMKGKLLQEWKEGEEVDIEESILNGIRK